VLDAQALAVVVVGLLAAVAAIIAALIAADSAKQARQANRIPELEEMIVRYRADLQRLYLYNRELVDHIYREVGPPPPPPPAGLFK